MIYATRKHAICAGHRVYNQGGQCENLHGHNYRFELTCVADFGLNDKGMVMDFSDIKKHLCSWLDRNWDHKFLVWDEDPWREPLAKIDPRTVWVPFNPTAENIAIYLVEEVGPEVFKNTGVTLISCIVHETDNCSAEYNKTIAIAATKSI